MTNTHWRIALWAVMLAAVGWVAWSARLALLPFTVGAVVAYALSPIVDRLASLVPARTRTHDVIRRGVVVLLIYAAIFGSLAGVGIAIVPTAVEQARDFFDELPEIVSDARIEATQWMDQFRTSMPDDLRNGIDEAVEDLSDRSAEMAGTLITGSASSITSAIGIVLGFLIVPFWLFYALRDRHFVERNFMRAVPGVLQADVMYVARIADYLLGRYIRAQLLLGVIVGTAIGVSMTLLGVKFSIGLGLWAGITELIPILGPWLGAVAGIIVVLATDPGLVVWVALIYFVVQQIENNLLVPRVQGSAVDIHPAMVIMLLAVAGSIWGLIGMIVVVPATAILRELFWYADRRLRGVPPDEAFAVSHVGQRQMDLPLDARVDAPAPPSAAAADAGANVDQGTQAPQPAPGDS